jgi:hypothetical protein
VASWCSKCGAVDTHILPVEPLYDPEVAASLVPSTRRSLMQILQRNKAQFAAASLPDLAAAPAPAHQCDRDPMGRERLIRRRAKWPKAAAP